MEETTNLTTSVNNTINEIFSNIFSSVDKNVYEILDKITFIDTSIMEKENFLKIFGTDSSSGIIMICNALVIGFLIYYATKYLFSHLTYSKVQTPLQFIFKLIIFVILMNNSYWLCSQIINIISLISKNVVNIGESLFGEEITFSNFIEKINMNFNNEIVVTSFDGIIKSFSTMGFVNLIFSYSLRYIMIQIFILFFPFAILCLINEKTEWIFKGLVKSFILLLLEQVLISTILILAFSFKISSNDTMSKILYVGIIYALMKANHYMYMVFGGITTSVTNGMNMLYNKNS